MPSGQGCFVSVAYIIDTRAVFYWVERSDETELGETSECNLQSHNHSSRLPHAQMLYWSNWHCCSPSRLAVSTQPLFSRMHHHLSCADAAGRKSEVPARQVEIFKVGCQREMSQVKSILRPDNIPLQM